MSRFKSLPFFLLLLVTFGTAGIEKLVAFTVPAWFLTQFQGSLLDFYPGTLVASFIFITLMELLTFCLILLGLVKKNKFQLYYGIILAQLTFVILGFGQRLTHKHESAASLFFYATLTFIAGHIALKDESKDLDA